MKFREPKKAVKTLASQHMFPQHFLFFFHLIETWNIFSIFLISCMKNLHHILGVPRRLLIPTPVYKEADNKVLEEVLVITFYLMAGQTSVIKGDTIIHFGFGKNSYIGELSQFKQRNL